jgi:hypothetical protein
VIYGILRYCGHHQVPLPRGANWNRAKLQPPRRHYPKGLDECAPYVKVLVNRLNAGDKPSQPLAELRRSLSFTA